MSLGIVEIYIKFNSSGSILQNMNTVKLSLLKTYAINSIAVLYDVRNSISALILYVWQGRFLIISSNRWNTKRQSLSRSSSSHTGIDFNMITQKRTIVSVLFQKLAKGPVPDCAYVTAVAVSWLAENESCSDLWKLDHSGTWFPSDLN